ncbi:pyruvate, water dikinase regulatory protein [Methylotenera sp.]|uniref:pyruvate, water dikinase regulatory protein n=2 Tax=Methylotenera sp. TaxID=2051956 RepID=UPI002730A041|nr:pyruvate, water dikinase regulatory protein [Methylotenera sp.]MDP2072107.1 pyruvate, water dikinase regulatory protein [Methylotenera sp.]MDP2230683.1 pyruvate, water dikinase regulatory protein [Methylotenera sp.]MDP3006883.1 pyruvate, water dikinase regulatory protein [Methylotenera sp.]MDP3007180.1 pyruvate, water dikinase regulatory protein [Methylotenera sp.]MDP3140900.1 pyruvate, water dikinase regulatory protein [Methylotenera sp.]
MLKRTVFFISDGTGITAGALGKLLEHFPGTNFTQVRLPFTDTLDKIKLAQDAILNAAEEDGGRPVVIMTLGNIELRSTLKESNAYFIDLFNTFIDPLSLELDQKPLRGAGIAHSVMGSKYNDRMEAVNFTLNHDDGMTNSGLEEADVILIGVSRCGKTPTSVYLAMQFGIKAANYPLIPEDFERGSLPAVLHKHLDKIFGLTIKPERLHAVRNERRSGSFYASIENCRKEIVTAENLMRNAGITWADSTSRSVEELSAIIMEKTRKAS